MGNFLGSYVHSTVGVGMDLKNFVDLKDLHKKIKGLNVRSKVLKKAKELEEKKNAKNKKVL